MASPTASRTAFRADRLKKPHTQSQSPSQSQSRSQSQSPRRSHRPPTDVGAGRPALRRFGAPWQLYQRPIAAIVAALAAPVFAADEAPKQPPTQRVEVRGQRTAPATTEPTSTLRGAALSNRVESTLGATLQSELGTANASFGPNVGLPLVRGQGGPRVRAMVDGLGTHDASTISADHGVMVEPALAESITVWRGPSTIRFGGGAIGGAVEIDEGRTPRLPREHVEARGALRAGTGGAGLALLRADGPVPGGDAAGLVWHADIHGRRQGEVPIPGRAIDEDALRRQFQLLNTVNTDGFIGNSRSAIEGGAIGLGSVGERGQIGLAWSRLRQVYGIPPGGHSHSHPTVPGDPAPTGDDEVRIHARQQRLDLRAETRVPIGWLPAAREPGTLRLRAARVDYAHDEREGPRLSTTFENRVDEMRLELDHRWHEQITGTWGLQWQRREFAALGEEAFVPRTDIQGGAVFALQRWRPAPWLVEIGLRAEWQRYAPAGGFEVLGQPREFPARRFWPRSASVAVQRSYGGAAAELEEPTDNPSAGGSLTLTHWQVGRAPDVQELYAAGPHLATRSFDFGNSALSMETLHAWDLAWVHRQGPFSWRSNAFTYRSRDYIYQRSLGWFYEAEEGQPQAACARLDRCLPATKREQAPARFFGYETEFAYEHRSEHGRWKVAAFSDLVRGQLTDGAEIPRLPPQRYGFALEAGADGWSGQARWTHGRAQTRPGDNETSTAAFNRLDASLRWTAAADAVNGLGLTLFVIGRNLGNQSIRNSTSFLRNYAPEPGRAFEIGVEATL